MVHIADAQTERARLAAVFAQRRTDALAEIFDETAEKFGVDRSAFDGCLARDGFGRRGQHHFASIESARALPDLSANDFAKRGFESGSRYLAQISDRGDAALR